MGSKEWRPAARWARPSQSAAARIPAAYGERSRALRRSSIVSPAASKPTRCFPGDSPALTETTSRSSMVVRRGWPAQVHGRRDHPAEERDPEAEIGCRNGGGALVG